MREFRFLIGYERELAKELTDSEQGALVVSAAGQMRFFSRGSYWGGLPESNLDQAKFTDVKLTSPWALVANQVRIRCYPAELATSLATIWTLRAKSP